MLLQKLIWILLYGIEYNQCQKLEDLLVSIKKPTALSDKDINLILEKAKNKAAAKPKISFDEGEMVRINEGPFANFNGIVESFDLVSGVLKLNVSIFGRNTPVEISYTQVERIV